jgi:hypothetical protein
MAKPTQRPVTQSAGRKPLSKHAGSKRKSMGEGPPVDADTKAIKILLSRYVSCTWNYMRWCRLLVVDSGERKYGF